MVTSSSGICGTPVSNGQGGAWRPAAVTHHGRSLTYGNDPENTERVTITLCDELLYRPGGIGQRLPAEFWSYQGLGNVD